MKDIEMINLQIFAEDEDDDNGVNKAKDFEPAISIDFTSRISAGIKTLQRILGIEQEEPMPEGSVIKIYDFEEVELAEQVGEGEDILPTKVKRKLVDTIDMVLDKYIRPTSAEAIQRVGREIAITQSDDKMTGAIRKKIKKGFFDQIKAGSGEADAGATLQAALANVWGAMQKGFDDEDVTPIFFVSSDDVAAYLGTANVSTQTDFGFTYIENFLGLGTTFVTPALTKGEVYGTAEENLHMAYIPANGTVGQIFGLTSDATGLIGMKHSVNDDNATIRTLMMSGVKFYPEYRNKVYKSTVTGA